MGSLIIGFVFLLAAIAVMFVAFPEPLKIVKKILVPVLFSLSLLTVGSGAVGYNDAGYCQHIRTIMGTESSRCTTGWYFQGWGTTTEWPHFITVAHTTDATGENAVTVFQGSISGPYPVRLGDNWNGDVTQTTRFGIPQDDHQFLKMARDFRSPERLISTTLRPAVTASLDSVANLFTMEEYYAGGKRDQFKTEFRDAMEKGRAQVRQVTATFVGGINRSGAAASDLEAVQDTSVIGDETTRRNIMEKVLVNGQEVREPHAFMEYGIDISSAIIENLDPDDRFEEQIQARKDAASRRIVAQEQRKEQEEQRLLAIQAGETEIAKRQAQAKVEQIEQTTNAETQKMLALIEASRMKEQAEVDRQTAEIRYEQAKVDGEAQKVLADAEAYAKQAILEADDALAQKLEAWVNVQRVWADAASNINVPSTVFQMGGEGGTSGNALGTVEAFMAMMMANAAQSINLDPSIGTAPKAAE